MFWKNKEKTVEGIKQAVKDCASIHANNFGATRRATSMIPIAAVGTHEIAHTSSVRFHQLLISLEGNQRTGCLRIISPKRKSRSAILIYKGRVVGCLYGCKRMDHQYLQQDAHRAALADLAQPGNVLDAYELPEELVLAAASLFNGDILHIDPYMNSNEALDQSIRAIAESKLPGCAVVSTQDDEMVCMVYISNGKIIGVFSARDGWVKPSYEAAMSYVSIGKRTKIQASYMPIANVETAQIGFSLTGLADAPGNRRKEMVAQQLQAVDSFMQMRGSDAKTYSTMEPVMGRAPRNATAKKPRWTNDAISAVRSHNVFAIAP